MYNEELFKKLEATFGMEKMQIFAEVMTARHEILHIEYLEEGIDDFSEEDFERDWWFNKHIEICNTLKRDKIIDNVIERFRKRSAVGIVKYGTTLEENQTDDFLIHLQEELMDGVNYIEKIKDTLNKKGFKKLEDIPNNNDFNEKIE